MENQPILNDLGPDPRRRKNAGTSLAVRPHYIEAPYQEVIEEPGPGLLLEYWDILRRQKGTLVLIAFAGFLAALLFTLPQTPIYRARASLEIQNLNENFLNMRDVNPTTNEGSSSPAESDLETQVKILQSESVLEGVIVKLKLPQRFASGRDRSRLSAWRKALGLSGPPAGATREELLRRVAKNLTIQTEPKTRLVEILYNSADPQLATDFANTLTAEFIQQNLKARWKTTQQTGEWLTRQMDDVRIRLEKSEDELQSYAHASGLLFTSEKVGLQLVEGNVAEDKLRQLQEELSRAHADRVAKQSVYESALSAPPESLPEVLDDKTLGEYQVKLTDLRRQLAELSSSLTPAHPAVQKVQAQVTTLESALEKERADVIQRIRNEYQSAHRREHLLAANYASQARLVSEQAAKVAHYNILKSDVETYRQLYDSMLHNVQEVGMTSALRASNIRVVDAAYPPSRPFKPSLVLNSALGLLAGAFFGFAFVVMRERADRSFQTPGETGLSLGLPELGVIPYASAERNRLSAYYRDTLPKSRNWGFGVRDSAGGVRHLESGNRNPADGALTLDLANQDAGNGTWDTAKRNRQRTTDTESRTNDQGPVTQDNGHLYRRVELMASRHSPSVLAESFRATATSILYSGENGNRPRVIVLTSAGPGEGKTTVASNLALALADTGSPVLLIDGDLRKGRLHEIFQVSNDWGLSDVLAGNALPPGRAAAYLETRYPRLSLLPAGATPASIAGLLYSPRTLEFLNHMRQEFHTVIIDSPPMLQVPDARVLGKMADAVVLVVRADETKREEASAAAQRLAADGTRVLGTILNEWDSRKSRHYGYAYAHSYYQVSSD